MKNNKYIIKTLNVYDTGGGHWVFYGKLNNNLWFTYLEDVACIWNKKPLDISFFEDGTIWESKHLVESLEETDIRNQYFFKEIYNMINNISNINDELKEILHRNLEFIYDSLDYENEKFQKVEILSVWETDYKDIACNAVLYKDNKKIANIIDSFDENKIRYVYGNFDTSFNENLIKKSCCALVNNKFNEYMKLPKISECSRLLQQIYDGVCSSDSSKFHIDNSDWDEYYSEIFNDIDVEILKNEIIKYHLEEVITIDDNNYKIIGYGDLQMRFNDDRELESNNEIEM